MEEVESYETDLGRDLYCKYRSHIIPSKDIIKGEELGNGNFAVVHKGQYVKEGIPVALKFLKGR